MSRIICSQCGYVFQEIENDMDEDIYSSDPCPNCNFDENEQNEEEY